MNRRTLLASGLAASVATPALANIADLNTRTWTSQNASWTPAARRHAHAGLATAYMAKLIRDQHLVAGTNTYPIEARVEFSRLRFFVDIGRAWDSEHGYRAERTGPVVSVFDGDIKITEARVYAYTGSAFPELPPFSMTTDSINYKALKAELGERVRYDHSRLFQDLEAYRNRTEVA